MKAETGKFHIEQVYYVPVSDPGMAKKIDVHLNKGEFIVGTFFDSGYLWVVSNHKRLWKSTECNPEYMDLVEVIDERDPGK